MGVTAPPGMHQGKSQIYDGFATIRSTRSSRVRLKDSASLGSSPASAHLTTGHSEYFTLRRNNKQTFLDNNNVARMIKTDPPIIDNSRIVFEEPIYAKVSPPNSNNTSPSKSMNGRPEVHYDSIDIKPKRKELHRKDRPKHRDNPTEVRVTPIVQDTDRVSSNDFSEIHKNEIKPYQNGLHKSSDTLSDKNSLHRVSIIPYGDYEYARTNSESYSETGSFETTNDPLDTKEYNDDVLKELPTVPRFHRSPQKYATLNMRRPKSIDIKPTYENPNYGSLNRAKIGHCSEPNTPVTGHQPLDKSFEIESGLPSPMELNNFSYPNALTKRNGVRRSNSEVGGFYNRIPNLHNTLPNYRHSVSVDVSSSSMGKTHVCCECVTGIPSNCESPRGFPLSPGISKSSGFSQTLDTLYEAQDPKVGCQTILRSKPPVPWWDLAIRKARYQSCPILDEVNTLSIFCLLLAHENMPFPD